MRKLAMIVAGLLTLSLSACHNIVPKPEQEDTKVLVAYFSATGTTKAVANDLALAAGADVYEIQPEEPYTEADLNWRNEESRSSVEMKDKTSRPAISGKCNNMDKYEVVFVGFPIWWNTCPTIINTFLESYDFTGKTVVPFATSGGSDMSNTNAELKAAYPKLNWKTGKLLNKYTADDIVQWINEINGE